MRLGVYSGEICSGVEQIVAYKLEQIAVELVSSRLRHRTGLRARGAARRGGQRAGFHLELLQRIRERQRKTQVVIRVGMQCAVESIANTAGQPACHANVLLARHAA